MAVGPASRGVRQPRGAGTCSSTSHMVSYTPGFQVRAEALVELQAGGLPEVFGYREHREALGARMFDPADVRRG